jgi:MYND finger
VLPVETITHCPCVRRKECCFHCGKIGATESGVHCNRCKYVWYCTAICRKRDQGAHYTGLLCGPVQSEHNRLLQQPSAAALLKEGGCLDAMFLSHVLMVRCLPPEGYPSPAASVQMYAGLCQIGWEDLLFAKQFGSTALPRAVLSLWTAPSVNLLLMYETCCR